MLTCYACKANIMHAATKQVHRAQSYHKLLRRHGWLTSVVCSALSQGVINGRLTVAPSAPLLLLFQDLPGQC